MANTTLAELNNGLTMPYLGLGTWRSNPGQVAAAVKHALKVGYRHIDGAHVYENEKEVGEGIRAAMKEFGLERKQIFVTSKLWNTKHHPEDVEVSCRKSLEDLGLDYVDLYLIHWPQGYARGDVLFPTENGKTKHDTEPDPTRTWLEMEKLLAKGLTKSIGVSNFNSRQLQDILDKGSVVPVVNQVELHPYFPQEELRQFCAKHKILLTGYSPLGSPERPWAKPGEPNLLEEPKLIEIGKKHGKTVAQVLIRWQIQRGIIVIPKSVTPARIEENAQVFDFTLTDEDMAAIATLNKGKQGRLIFNPDDSDHPHFPFKADIDF